jgi:hypothetical protein
MFLLKWLVIPVGLAALGFFVVGPRLLPAAEPAKNEPKAEVVEQDDPNKQKITGNPEVEVSVAPASHRRTNRRRSHRKTEETHKPAPDVPSPDEEPPRNNPDGG